MNRLFITFICITLVPICVISCVKEDHAPVVTKPTFGKSATVQVSNGKLDISMPVTFSSDFRYSSCGIRVEADGRKDYPEAVANGSISVSLDAFEYSGKEIKICSYFSSGTGSEVVSPETSFSVPVLAKDIEISGINAAVPVDKNYSLELAVSPSGAAENTFEWSSSNSKVATVDSKGVVKTLSSGEVTFTARSKESGMSGLVTTVVYGFSSKTTIVKVENGKLRLSRVIDDVSSVSSGEMGFYVVEKGQTSKTEIRGVAQDNVFVAETDAYPLSGKTIQISFFVRVKDNPEIETLKVEKTIPVLAQSVGFENSRMDVMVGYRDTPSYTVSPSNADKSAFSWSSSDSNVATITSDGKITVKGSGKTTIEVMDSYSGLSDQFSLIVWGTVSIKSLALSNGQLFMESSNVSMPESPDECGFILNVEGQSERLVPVSITNGKMATSVDASQYSGKTVEVQVYFVKHDFNFKSEEKRIAVSKKIESITLKQTEVTVEVGVTKQLSISVLPSGGVENSLEWIIDDSKIATVDSQGKTKGISVGETKVYVRSNEWGVQATGCIKVVEANYNDLSAKSTANCYIVTQSGNYCLSAVKGNTSTSVGSVAKVEVLWESFGTSTKPSVGDLVSNVSYADGKIRFTASDKKGNAVIAAKDASGTILWSWHIWLTDRPIGQVYYNSAGTMMDRNLGATSAESGDVQALGLLYQWGRKDPFLNSCSISESTKAASTLSWPSSTWSNSSTGTIEYAVSHPTTFIEDNPYNSDWYYTGAYYTLDSRWFSLDGDKRMYDPCPPGYRVPDGGYGNVWMKAFGTGYSWAKPSWDSVNRGVNFSKTMGSSSVIWYPAAGHIYREDGKLRYVGGGGYYWTTAPANSCAYALRIESEASDSEVQFSRAYGMSVRCIKE